MQAAVAVFDPTRNPLFTVYFLPFGNQGTYIPFQLCKLKLNPMPARIFVVKPLDHLGIVLTLWGLRECVWVGN